MQNNLIAIHVTRAVKLARASAVATRVVTKLAGLATTLGNAIAPIGKIPALLPPGSSKAVLQSEGALKQLPEMRSRAPAPSTLPEEIPVSPKAVVDPAINVGNTTAGRGADVPLPPSAHYPAAPDSTYAGKAISVPKAPAAAPRLKADPVPLKDLAKFQAQRAVANILQNPGKSTVIAGGAAGVGSVANELTSDGKQPTSSPTADVANPVAPAVQPVVPPTSSPTAAPVTAPVPADKLMTMGEQLAAARNDPEQFRSIVADMKAQSVVDYRKANNISTEVELTPVQQAAADSAFTKSRDQALVEAAKQGPLTYVGSKWPSALGGLDDKAILASTQQDIVAKVKETTEAIKSGNKSVMESSKNLGLMGFIEQNPQALLVPAGLLMMLFGGKTGLILGGLAAAWGGKGLYNKWQELQDVPMQQAWAKNSLAISKMPKAEQDAAISAQDAWLKSPSTDAADAKLKSFFFSMGAVSSAASEYANSQIDQGGQTALNDLVGPSQAAAAYAPKVDMPAVAAQ